MTSYTAKDDAVHQPSNKQGEKYILQYLCTRVVLLSCFNFFLLDDVGDEGSDDGDKSGAEKYDRVSAETLPVKPVEKGSRELFGVGVPTQNKSSPSGEKVEGMIIHQRPLPPSPKSKPSGCTGCFCKCTIL